MLFDMFKIDINLYGGLTNICIIRVSVGLEVTYHSHLECLVGVPGVALSLVGALSIPPKSTLLDFNIWGFTGEK